jgi:hypothetical protein
VNAPAKPYELVSDERLQFLIDEQKRQYTRERGSDRNVFDTIMALTELREMRKNLRNNFAAALKVSA